MSTEKIGVLIVHGMGSQEETFAEPLIAELTRRLGADRDRFEWEAVYWAKQLMMREGRLLEQLGSAVQPDGKSIDLKWATLRRFVFHNFGDAVAYQRQHDEARSGVYEQIHGIVSHHLQRLKARLPHPHSPIVVMAHSLGGHIMSNYIWDHQPDKTGKVPVTGHEPLPALLAMITFGCNIPLFSLSFERAQPIHVPGDAITQPALIDASRWLNFLDADDVLGWPLRPLYAKDFDTLSPRQQATVHRIHDIAINVGNLLWESWTPISHGAYWSDDHFTKPVADYLKILRAALNRAGPTPGTASQPDRPGDFYPATAVFNRLRTNAT